MGQKMKRCY